MPGLYEERYSGITVKHLHHQLQQRHSYKLGGADSLCKSRSASCARICARHGARSGIRDRRLAIFQGPHRLAN
jgi:hypothetical protein